MASNIINNNVITTVLDSNIFDKNQEVTTNVNENKSKKKKSRKKKNRCNFDDCRRKLRMPIPCACGKDFCSQHRLPFEHDCTIDRKEKQRKKIASQNKRIKRDKIVKI